ncbi:MAG: hypothetical protein JNM17_17235, partial [Archangium sp.]|nr:hypothetical protein [Archangium sp.]
ASGLAPGPRKVTPIDQPDTRVNDNRVQQSPWASNETTVKAQIDSTQPLQGPIPEAAINAPTTSPERDTMPGSGASSIIFKVATALLVLLALTIGGLYVWNTMQKKPEVYVPPPNAPLTGTGRPWEYDPPREKRRATDATRIGQEGDDAWHKGAIEFALSRYLEAWNADPQPELALKIGELYYLKDDPEDARQWWTRYRKDMPSSKALPYIEPVINGQ